MKKTVTWNGLIAMAAVLAMSAFVFSCTDEQSTVNEEAGGNLTAKGTIRGLVLDVHTNAPIEGAEAWLRYPGGSQKKKTNASGQYVFSGVPVSGHLPCDCEEIYDCDCAGEPYLITVVAPPVTDPETESVLYEYAVTYTAALLSFVNADSSSTIVSNLMTEAVPASMRRLNATVNGFVKEDATGLPISGAVVTLSLTSNMGPPDASKIMRWNQSSWAIPDSTALTSTDGVFSFSGVPEGTDAKKVKYVVSLSAPGFVLCDYYMPNGDGDGDGDWDGSCDCWDGEEFPCVCVGTGNHTYWVDTVPGNFNKADAIALCPGLPPSDDINPYVIATNVPPSVISDALFDATFCWKFNEPMNLLLGDVTVSQQGAGPIAQNTLLTGWNLDLGLFDPPLTDEACIPTASNPVYYYTPDEPLPEGRRIFIELRRMEDVATNAYEGDLPDGSSDAFGGTWDNNVIVYKGVTTQGDPDLMCVLNAPTQAAPTLDPTMDVGGLSSNVPQANNLNLLFCRDGMGDLNEIGDQNEEANWISLSWLPAIPCNEEEDGVVVSYNVYAENTGLGFDLGIPLKVGAVSADFVAPQTTWEGFLELDVPFVTTDDYVNANWPDDSVNTAIRYYNLGDPPLDIPLVEPPSFFDDGFQLPMAVTAVNNDGREGPYSPPVLVRDVVPPTVADQGDGFDETVPTNWAILEVGADEVALYPEDSIPGLGTIDEELTDDNVYDEASYTAWLAEPRSLDIVMTEDLANPQEPTVTLNALGGGGETVASASVTQYEHASVDCDMAQVTVVFNNLALVQQNDHVGIAVVDETGINVSDPGTVVGGLLSGDSVAHLYDELVPLIISGTVVAGTGTEEIMTLTFAEPVCVNDPETNLCPDNSADDDANYYLNGGSLSGVVDVDVDETGTIVTLTAETGFGVTNAYYPVLATVMDLQGNYQSYAPGALWFSVDDEIAPVIISCYHSSAPDINISDPALGDDGEWTVGDDGDATEIFTITCDLTEELASGVAVTYAADSGASDPATCSRTGTLTLTTTDVTFEITCTAGTVAEGDSIDVLGFDLAGNQLSPAITLEDVGEGTNIDPFPPPL